MFLSGVPGLTKYSEGIFRFDGDGCILREDGHHVQEVFKGAVPILARAEHETNPVPKGIHLQLWIIQHDLHGQADQLVTLHVLRCQGLELVVHAARQRIMVEQLLTNGLPPSLGVLCVGCLHHDFSCGEVGEVRVVFHLFLRENTLTFTHPRPPPPKYFLPSKTDDSLFLL